MAFIIIRLCQPGGACLYQVYPRKSLFFAFPKEEEAKSGYRHENQEGIYEPGFHSASHRG